MKNSCIIIITLILYFCLGACAKQYCGVGHSSVLGCPAYNPDDNPGSSPPVVLRSRKEAKEDLEVSTAVLSDTETQDIFGLDMANEGIQPVWISIKNNSNNPYYLVKVYTDEYYFTPNEAAIMNHLTFAVDVNKAIDSYVNDHAIRREVPPNSEVSGFYYSTLDPGSKYLNLIFYGKGDIKQFSFYHEVPGLKLDYQRVDFEKLYKQHEIVELKSCENLRKIIKSIPCCTQRKDGSGENDPLNFVAIGKPEVIFEAFARQGWDVTETINVGSGLKAIKAFFSNAQWRTAPMSALYFYNRPQDIAFQKARSTIHERNHMRLWLTKYTYRGDTLWVGAISRDIGSYLTWKTQWKTAHAIDPDIDESRDYLVQDLIYSQSLKEFGILANTLNKANRENPHINFMGQPWWTDGGRAVLVFDKDSRSLDDLEIFDCEKD